MTVQREAQSTTPSPRNAPPMTDRDRLVEIVQRFQWNRTMDSLVDALLAEGVTLPPGKAGPVTSEEAVSVLFGRGFRGSLSVEEFEVARHRLARRADAAMPLLARDHGLLTPEEVEARLREWWERNDLVVGSEYMCDLLSALTRPAPGGPDGR